MNQQKIESFLWDMLENDPDRCLSSDKAIKPQYAGMKYFEKPLIGAARAADECFGRLKQPGVVGSHFVLPREWLKSGNAVISIFLPYTQEIKEANARDMAWPSEEWLQARIEGDAFMNKITLALVDMLNKNGYKSVAPQMEKGFKTGKECGAETEFTSNWSQRHVAYVCGLGTFGLSKGFITKLGTAGRLTSIVTELMLPANERDYKGVYEYCSMCGKCAINCPSGAISIEGGKIHSVCSDFLDKVRGKHSPRYGCGKCQVKVPCQSRIPPVKKARS